MYDWAEFRHLSYFTQDPGKERISRCGGARTPYVVAKPYGPGPAVSEPVIRSPLPEVEKRTDLSYRNRTRLYYTGPSIPIQIRRIPINELEMWQISPAFAYSRLLREHTAH